MDLFVRLTPDIRDNTNIYDIILILALIHWQFSTIITISCYEKDYLIGLKFVGKNYSFGKIFVTKNLSLSPDEKFP